MAESKENFMTNGLSGTIGKLITISNRAGKTIYGKVRKKTKIPPTEDQLEIRSTFAMAVIYAKSVILDPVTKALYQAKTPAGKSAYNIACSDACTPPKVLNINKDNYLGASTDTIQVKATDDFKVARVKVSIHTASGLLVEEGNAVMAINGLDWVYTVAGENEDFAGSKIRATAYDLPGNEHSLEITV